MNKTKVKLTKFLDGLESSKEFLTVGRIYPVWDTGESEGSLLIYDDESEICEIFFGEYEVIQE